MENEIDGEPVVTVGPITRDVTIKDRIYKIKENAGNIDIDQLIKTGKNVFGKDSYSEFDPPETEVETYTCYIDRDRMVLECFLKFSFRNAGIDGELKDSDFFKHRFMIYMQGNQIKELVGREKYTAEKENQAAYDEALEVIANANARSDLAKQHIRNFFRRMFRGKKLLTEQTESLTRAEIETMLGAIKEKPANFMSKYPTEKTEEERIAESEQPQIVVEPSKEEEQEV